MLRKILTALVAALTLASPAAAQNVLKIGRAHV